MTCKGKLGPLHNHRWQEEYGHLHKLIRSGVQSPRYLVSVAVEAGVADRIAGAMTELYFAILSSRAFTMVTYGWLPPFEAACNSNYINWTMTLPDNLIEPLKFTYRGQRGYSGQRRYPDRPEYKEYYPLFLVNKEHAFMQTSNLSTQPPEASHTPYIVMSSNRGRSVALFDNPFERHKLWMWGLTPETIMSCGMRFICQPNDEVTQLYGPTWRELTAANTFSIAIQLRAGDHIFTKDFTDPSSALEQWQHYFDCATAIEATYARPGQRVRWYVTADSLALRRAAKLKYGDKVLTDETLDMKHPDCYHNTNACVGGTMVDSHAIL